MVECVSVQLPQGACLNGRNAGSSWRIVQQGQLSKGITRRIRLQEGWIIVAWEDLGTGESTLANNIQAVALLALLDDHIVHIDLDLLHGIHHNVLFEVVEGREHEGHAQLVIDLLLGV